MKFSIASFNSLSGYNNLFKSSSYLSSNKLFSAISYPTVARRLHNYHNNYQPYNSMAVNNNSTAANYSTTRSKSLSIVSKAYKIIDTDSSHCNSPYLLTCEHAALELPSSTQWSASDKQSFVGTHWSYDPGALDFMQEFTQLQPALAISSTVSRLFCDVNRPKGSETMFRNKADNKPIEINQSLTAEEIEARMATFYHPYHEKLLELIELRRPKLLISCHSFTPCYEGQLRAVEIGVLYRDEKDLALATALTAAFNSAGINTKINEPWSGKEGFMFAVDNAAILALEKGVCSAENKRQGIHTIMLEFRNDLLTQPQWRHKILPIFLQTLNNQKL
jgi:predicted N-formylglutamate amidohydrolase